MPIGQTTVIHILIASFVHSFIHSYFHSFVLQPVDQQIKSNLFLLVNQIYFSFCYSVTYSLIKHTITNNIIEFIIVIDVNQNSPAHPTHTPPTHHPPTQHTSKTQSDYPYHRHRANLLEIKGRIDGGQILEAQHRGTAVATHHRSRQFPERHHLPKQIRSARSQNQT